GRATSGVPANTTLTPYLQGHHGTAARTRPGWGRRPGLRDRSDLVLVGLGDAELVDVVDLQLGDLLALRQQQLVPLPAPAVLLDGVGDRGGGDEPLGVVLLRALHDLLARTGLDDLAVLQHDD